MATRSLQQALYRRRIRWRLDLHERTYERIALEVQGGGCRSMSVSDTDGSIRQADCCKLNRIVLEDRD